MTSLADVVREHAPSYLARHHAAMPESHRRALQAITDCRTAALGAELTVCDDCHATHLVFHSCRHRACPRCGLDTTADWIERHQKAILPVPYFHVVFTLPVAAPPIPPAYDRPSPVPVSASRFAPAAAVV